jgi:2-iminobutanoate/2-iminopropanoate deaminase
MLKHVRSDKAPAAIGPYSQAVIANGFMYSAGQLALDPASGEMVKGDIVAQTERVMENLQHIHAPARAPRTDEVKLTVHLQDLAHFPAVNEIYARWIGDARPARSTVQVAALPRGALIEVDVIALLPSSS